MKRALLVLSVFSVIKISFALEPTCTVNSSGKIIDTTSCFTEADSQIVTLYKIGLCSSAPVSPTTNASADISSCQTVFNSTNGARAVIKKNIGLDLKGEGSILKPATGDYYYGYVIISPAISYAAKKKFASSQTDANGDVGNTCWTRSSAMRLKTDPYQVNFNCDNQDGNSGGSLGQNYSWGDVFYDSLDSSTFVATGSVTTSTGTFQGNLVDSSMRLAGSTSVAAYMAIIGPLSSPISITSNTKSLDLNFVLQRGARLKINSGVLQAMTNGEVDLRLIPK